MTTRRIYRLRATGLLLLLAGLSIPAVASDGPGSAAGSVVGPTVAATSSGAMRVGLTLVDDTAQAPPPEPASLDFPATSRALLCQADGQGYRECRTPFHGPVVLAREISGTRCVEDQNWGWREGRVWVSRGCAAVFVKTGET